MKLPILFSTICIASLVAGCGSTEEILIDGKHVERVEIYYRDFNVLSYMPYSEKHLVLTNDAALTIDSDREIRQVLDALPKECETQSGEGAKENLYALVRFYGADRTKLLRVYRFSRFSYTNSAIGSACKLDDSRREALRNMIVKLNTGKKV